jgi:hypothetical protein
MPARFIGFDPAGHRRYSVLNGKGDWMAGFVDVNRAHADAHRRVDRDGVDQPFYVIDPVGRCSWRINAVSCVRYAWGPGELDGGCPMSPSTDTVPSNPS